MRSFWGKNALRIFIIQPWNTVVFKRNERAPEIGGVMLLIACLPSTASDFKRKDSERLNPSQKTVVRKKTHKMRCGADGTSATGALCEQYFSLLD